MEETAKTEAPQKPTFTYAEIVSFDFATLMQKLANTQTNNKAASRIRQIIKRVQEARDKIAAEHKKEVFEVYGKRDEKGELVMEDDGQQFVPAEGKEEEISKFMTTFMAREVVIDWAPLDPSALADIKISAKEIGLLKDLFSEEPVGPANSFELHQMRNGKPPRPQLTN